MDKLKSIAFVLLSVLLINFSTNHDGNTAERDCFEGEEYADIRSRLREAADHPEYFKEIINIDDQRSVSEILRKIISLINEGNAKVKEGDLLVEQYKKEYQEFQDIYKIKNSLEAKLERDYQKLSYSAVSEIRREIERKNQELELKSNNYNKKIEKISAISQNLRSNATEIKNLKKEFRVKLKEIKVKQQGILNEEALFKRLGGTSCYD